MLMDIPPLASYCRAWKFLTQDKPRIYEQITYAAERGFRVLMDPIAATYAVIGWQQIVARCDRVESASLIAALLAAYHAGAPATGAISSQGQAGESLAPGRAQGD